MRPLVCPSCQSNQSRDQSDPHRCTRPRQLTASAAQTIRRSSAAPFRPQRSWPFAVDPAWQWDSAPCRNVSRRNSSADAQVEIPRASQKARNCRFRLTQLFPVSESWYCLLVACRTGPTSFQVSVAALPARTVTQRTLRCCHPCHRSTHLTSWCCTFCGLRLPLSRSRLLEVQRASYVCSLELVHAWAHA